MMRFVPNTHTDLLNALLRLPDDMRVEVGAGVAVEASTVSELRGVKLPQDVIIGIPEQHKSYGAVTVNKLR